MTDKKVLSKIFDFIKRNRAKLIAGGGGVLLAVCLATGIYAYQPTYSAIKTNRKEIICFS